MSDVIGTIADVAAERVEVGYASVYSLVNEHEILGSSLLVTSPRQSFYLKIEPAPESFFKVRATFVGSRRGYVDRMPIRQEKIRLAESDKERAHWQRVETVHRLAYELRLGSLLSVV